MHGFVDIVLVGCMMHYFDVHFMAKEVCQVRSLQRVTKAPVRIAKTMLPNSLDDSVRILLFSDSAFAIDEYK
jgi:hypothetical protein